MYKVKDLYNFIFDHKYISTDLESRDYSGKHVISINIFSNSNVIRIRKCCIESFNLQVNIMNRRESIKNK